GGHRHLLPVAERPSALSRATRRAPEEQPDPGRAKCRTRRGRSGFSVVLVPRGAAGPGALRTATVRNRRAAPAPIAIPAAAVPAGREAPRTEVLVPIPT